MLTIVVHGQQLHRNMACCGILLEMVENRPAQHIREENVERDGGRLIFASESHAIGAATCHEHFKALAVCQVSQDASIGQVSLHNEQTGDLGLGLKKG